MAALVVLTGDRAQPGVAMAIRGGAQGRAARVARRKARGRTEQHPRAAEVQAVEVGELRVRWVGDDARREPVAAAVPRQGRKEAVEPPRELGGPEHAPHEIGLGQAGGEEVLAGRLVGERAGAIRRRSSHGYARPRAPPSSVSPGRPRPVEDEAESEGGLRARPRGSESVSLGSHSRSSPGARVCSSGDQRRPTRPGPPVDPTPAARPRVGAARPGRRAARS